MIRLLGKEVPVSIQLIGSRRAFAEVTIGGLSGECGLTSRLHIGLDLIIWNRDPGSIGAMLRSPVADVLVRFEGSRELFMGRAVHTEATAPLRQFDDRTQAKIRLSIELSHVQLDALERERQGGTFSLAVAYRGLATDHQGHLDHLSGRDQREVSQSEWCNVLGQLNYHRSVLVEVPLPDEDAHPALAGTTRELAAATAALRQGRVRDAVGACRLALESLAHAIGEDHGTYNIVEVVRGNPHLDKQARFAALRKALTIVSHPAHHGDPNASAIEWHYEDAVALVMCTTSILRYYSSRLPNSQQD